MEEKTFELEERPGYKLAIPLFLLTALPFFGALIYDYAVRGDFDSAFIWFGSFYVLIGLVYWTKRFFRRVKN